MHGFRFDNIRMNHKCLHDIKGNPLQLGLVIPYMPLFANGLHAVLAIGVGEVQKDDADAMFMDKSSVYKYLNVYRRFQCECVREPGYWYACMFHCISTCRIPQRDVQFW